MLGPKLAATTLTSVASAGAQDMWTADHGPGASLAASSGVLALGPVDYCPPLGAFPS
jgi:hypothetical protein